MAQPVEGQLVLPTIALVPSADEATSQPNEKEPIFTRMLGAADELLQQVCLRITATPDAPEDAGAIAYVGTARIWSKVALSTPFLLLLLCHYAHEVTDVLGASFDSSTTWRRRAQSPHRLVRMHRREPRPPVPQQALGKFFAG